MEPLAVDQQVTDDDIIESGSGREPWLRWLPPRLSLPRWWPPRIAFILCLSGLVFGLAAGYCVGAWRVRPPGPALAVPGAAAVSVPPITAGGTPLGFDGSRCSLQVGHNLELGIEVTNDTPALLTILRVDTLLPARGLKQISWAWGPCGQLPGALPSDQALATGNSIWFTVTFHVLVSCPGPLPVGFAVRFDLRDPHDSRGAVATIPAFPDLSQVPYSGCQ